MTGMNVRFYAGYNGLRLGDGGEFYVLQLKLVLKLIRITEAQI
jgi:hypothetical protein